MPDKTRGRKPGNAKFPESLQMPCSTEMRETVESIAEETGMTVPAIMRRAVEMYIENYQDAQHKIKELRSFTKSLPQSD